MIRRRPVTLLLGALLLLLLAPAASAQLRPELEWGTGGSGPGQFDLPVAVATGFDGSVYVGDYRNFRIQKFDAFGRFLLQWRVVPPPSGGLAAANDVATDLFGHVYASTTHGEVEQFDERGTLLTRWAAGGPSGQPGGLATDVAGNVYVVDSNASQVSKYRPTGTLLARWGTRGTGPGQFRDPLDVAVSGPGNVFVTDHDNSRVQEFTPAGAFVLAWTVPPLPPASVSSPAGLAFDPLNHAFVVDIAGRIDEFTSAGSLVTTYGSPGSGRGQFDHPDDVASDCRGRLFVTDARNNRVVRFGNPFNGGPCPIEGRGVRVRPIDLFRPRVRFLTLCDLACAIIARARLRIPPDRTHGVTTIKVSGRFAAPPSSKQPLELKLSGSAPGLVKRALAAGKRVGLTLTVISRTQAGRQATVRKHVTLARKR